MILEILRAHRHNDVIGHGLLTDFTERPPHLPHHYMAPGRGRTTLRTVPSPNLSLEAIWR